MRYAHFAEICEKIRQEAKYAAITCSHKNGMPSGVAAASSDAGPNGGRGPLTVLEFSVFIFSVCLVLVVYRVLGDTFWPYLQFSTKFSNL